MEVWTHHRWRFPLAPQHKFPLDKYELLAERVVADGLVTPRELHEADPVEWAELAAVHDCGLLSRIREGCLTVREERGLGLPWSRALVERARRSVGGTVAAARHALEHDVAMNLGGGTHHAGRDFARGYCLFNDVAVAIAALRRDGLAERILVVDCDVHQGDGTADIFAEDPRTFTLSLHGARNYPFTRIASDLDVDIASGTGDARYLRALREALDFALARARPDFAFYLAGGPVRGRPDRAPRALQAGAARARRARARHADRDGRRGVRRARRRLRRGRRRHGRHQRRDGRRSGPAHAHSGFRLGTFVEFGCQTAHKRLR
jgi:acetoin utilization deacetylase AcuC-like enzyme